MTAIITDKIKYQLSQTIFDENQGSTPGDSDNFYYIAVGKSEAYQYLDSAGGTGNTTDTTVNPVNCDREERLFRYAMQSVKAVAGFSFVVDGSSTKDWTSGTEYSQFSDAVEGQPASSYYVKTTDNNVYICIRTGKSSTGTIQPSTVKPEHTNTGLPIQTDGYIWKFLYTISTADANKFSTSNFIPVKFVDSAAPTDPEFSQLSVQNAAVDGQIVGYRVLNQSSGGIYTVAPRLTIIGDGTHAKARAILDGSGRVNAVEVMDSNGSGVPTSNGATPDHYNFGANYNYAQVRCEDSSNLSSGTSAEIVPVFAPNGGLGADPRKDLKSTSIMFNIKPSGTEDSDATSQAGSWLVDNEYRQIALIKNPTRYDSAGGAGPKYRATSGRVMNAMKLTSVTGADKNVSTGYAIPFTDDPLIVGADSNARAYLNYYNDDRTLFYHQDEYTGFTPFRNGETVTVRTYTGGGTLIIDSADIEPDVDRFSGDILFLNSKAKVTRDRLQTEDIKLVVRL